MGREGCFAGRFLLLRRVGQGGMGDVHLARDLSTGRECALKRLTRGEATPSLDMARAEFEALTRVRHPRVVSVHEFGVSPEGEPFCVMDYVPGVPAPQAIALGDWGTLANVAAQVAHGLEALHAAGVVHGDLKPANLLVAPAAMRGQQPGGVWIVDFGLSVIWGRTAVGHTGTAGFAAPEVVRGGAPTPAADLYSLGATLYLLASRQPPFGPGDPGGVLRRQAAGPPSTLPLEEAGTPPRLVELILRLMAPEPGTRPRDAREARRALEALHAAARHPLHERLETVRLVGRERELAQLESWLARARVEPALQVLDGEPGTGKSTLLTELSTRAALAGWNCVHLSCGTFDAPGAVALAIARRLAADAAAQDGATRGEMREEELDSLVEETHRLAHMAGEGGRRPLVLLDDTERIDALSAAWIRRLACRPDPTVRWVLAHRPLRGGELDAERALVDAGFAARIHMQALDQAATQRLIAERLNDQPPAVLVEVLWSRSGGHPGLVVELLREAARFGAVVEDDSGIRVEPEALARLPGPADFEASLDARQASLSEPARGVLEALAVLGRGAETGEISLLEPAADPAVLEEILQAGLVRRWEAGWVAWPPAFGERIEATLPAARREALARRALRLPNLSSRERFRLLSRTGETLLALAAADEALETSPDPELCAAAAAVAESMDSAGAAARYQRAARLWMNRRAYATAIPLLERALELVPQGESRGPRLALLSTGLVNCGRLEDTRRLVETALGEGVDDASRALLMGNDAGRLLQEGRVTEFRQRAREVLEFASRAGAHMARAGTAFAMAHEALTSGRVDDAVSLATIVEESYALQEDPVGRLRGLELRAHILRVRNRLEEAEDAFHDLLSRAEAEGNRLGIDTALSHLAYILVHRGRWDEAGALYDRLQRLALEDGRASAVAVALTNRSFLAGVSGRVREALRGATRAIRLCRSAQPRNEAFAWRCRAQALRAGGHPRRALAAAFNARRRLSAMPEERQWNLLEIGRDHAAAGDWKRAAAVWDTVSGPLDSGEPVERAMITLFSGRAALRAGGRTEAEERLGAVETWLAGRDLPLVAAHAGILRAELALMTGSSAAAATAADAALRILGELGAVPDRAAAAMDLARCAPPSIEVRLVRTWLELAVRDCARLGNKRDRLVALSMLVDRSQFERGTTSGAGDRDLVEQVSWLLQSITEFPELARRAMRLAVEQLGAERGALLLVDRESGRLETVAEHGPMDEVSRREVFQFSRQVVSRVTESGGSLLVNNAPEDPAADSPSITRLGIQSILCVPLHVGHAVVGAVYLDDSRRPHQFGEEDRGVLEGFAHLMAVAFEQSRGHAEIERMQRVLEEENIALRQEVGSRFQVQGVIGASSQMRRILALVEHAARTNTTVLITGENGTGKELLARVLHHAGSRQRGPFVTVNCGALTETLLESELFGILAGTASGVRARDGRFVQANGGTLFLDEVGEMPLNQQVALLSVLANREVVPVGGGRPIPVDARVVAATNRNLRTMVTEGLFREDLFYRLSVLEIEVPPLREHKADIPALSRHFLERFALAQGREIPRLSPEFNAVLMQSDWPGNIRELQNYMERVLAMNPGDVLKPDPPPRDLQERAAGPRMPRGRGLLDAVTEIERKMVTQTLEKTGGNQSEAARLLGLTEQSLRYRIRKFQIAEHRRIRRTR